jgi:hypothetical protein
VCNETNLMHYISSVYSVTTPLHVLGSSLGGNNVYMQQLVRVVRFSRPSASQDGMAHEACRGAVTE